MPMVLLPPPLFSTTTGCFSRSPELLPDEAREDVGAAAGGVRDDDLDRLCRVVLRERAEREEECGEEASEVFFVIVLVRVRGCAVPNCWASD
jgi:hypothetical protein